MIRNSREKDFQAKQEVDTNDGKFSKASSSTSRQWSGFINPRIVRVSRSFGGKDRHSKVQTIRGLRDRRIRLSVPTAIQLYDLQDRLGLSQPSKVIDWLLDSTKHDIDKLPPLQIPQGSFGQFLQPAHESNNAPHSSLFPLFDANSTFLKDGEDQTIMAKSKYWDNPDAASKGKSMEVGGNYSEQISAQNLFPIANHSSIPGLLNNTVYHNWEPSNLSLSQFGFPSSQTEDPHSSNAAQLPSSFANLPSGSQLYFPPYYPPYITTPVESDPRQINHFQSLSPSSQHFLQNSLMPSYHSINSSPMKSFPFNVSPKLHPLQSNNESQPNKDDTSS